MFNIHLILLGAGGFTAAVLPLGSCPRIIVDIISSAQVTLTLYRGYKTPLVARRVETKLLHVPWLY